MPVGWPGSTLVYTPSRAERYILPSYPRAVAIPRTSVDAQVAKNAKEWIIDALGRLKQPRSTAVITGALFKKDDEPIPCIFLSLGAPEKYADAGIKPPVGIPLYIARGQYRPLGDGSWKKKLQGAADLQLKLFEMSLGWRGGIQRTEKKIYDYTCAHCAPKAVAGTKLVSPSAFEITNVLQNHRPHTSFADNRKLHAGPGKQAYVENILRTFVCDPPVDLDNLEATGKEVKSASGQVIGTVVARFFRRATRILSRFNQELKEAGLQEFGATPEHPFTMDWILFEAVPDRVGFNVFSEEFEGEVESIPVFSLGYAVESLPVHKLGRTTGHGEGNINGFTAAI